MQCTLFKALLWLVKIASNSCMCAQGQLKSANVGDSGFLVIGRAQFGDQLAMKYHSPQQEHSFGCPYQLGHYDGADSPEDAMLMTVPVGASLPVLILCNLSGFGQLSSFAF